ncbi:hypothetical protein PAPYR_12374 [Paratrimastix pyriformis]|uniref:Uncharacterized protein n=1 Tax=Paratrimastix pyriformis TaxID=342808 RepID=A0ABQ8U6K2_9EUKA|nr:hypothetical protein PAPYR_12374 [Paratrimastix pyriformis]
MKIATFLNHTRNHFCLHFADSRLRGLFDLFTQPPPGSLHSSILAPSSLVALFLFLPTLISSSPFSLLDALFILTPFLVGLFFVGLLALFKKRALRKNREGLLVSNFLLSEGTWVAFFIIFHSIHIVLSYLYPEHVWDLLLFGHISPVWLRLIRWRLLPVLFLAAGCGYIAAALLVSPAQGVMKTLPLFFGSWQILAWRNDMVTRKMTSRGLLVSCQQMGRATVVALHPQLPHGRPLSGPAPHPSIHPLFAASWADRGLDDDRSLARSLACGTGIRVGCGARLPRRLGRRLADDQLLAVSVESEVGPKHMARRLQALVGLLDQLRPASI